MQHSDQQWYFSFLRYSLGIGEIPEALSSDKWKWLHSQAKKQSLLGIIFCGIQRLPETSRPDRQVVFRWSMEAEALRGKNAVVTDLASRVTKMFVAQGCRPIILKGQANARLYPDPALRQPGDVDILIPGGRRAVIECLKKMDLFAGAEVSSHHVGLAKNLFETEVEVHFVATESNSPSKNKNLQRFLSAESEKAVLVPEGFYVPPDSYALVMQLSHIRQHFFSTGIGLRQLVDYYQLLVHSAAEDRQRVKELLPSFGLSHVAGAVMWVLGHVLCLDETLMICKPDARRGKWLLRVIMNGGNFGYYADNCKQPLFKRWLSDRVRNIRLLKFDFSEAFWHELRYWVQTTSLIPRRIKRGRIALGKR